MRQVQASVITDAVADLCMEANYRIGKDIINAMEKARETESSPVGKEILGLILENDAIADQDNVPACQDTGMAIVFVEIGQDVHVVGGSLEEAINVGVRKGYTEGYLRKSVVKDPIRRGNTGDNTPAVIHYEIVPGDKLKITVAPKGFGSENMSGIKMCKPSEGLDGVRNFILDTVDKAGSNPCPPIVVGVGIGGSFEKAAYLAKKALLRKVGEHNEDPYYADLEKEMLEKVNQLGIGPQGLGGVTTALAVNIEAYPTHIAGMPVAVNISCHCTRHAEWEYEG